MIRKDSVPIARVQSKDAEKQAWEKDKDCLGRENDGYLQREHEVWTVLGRRANILAVPDAN